MKKPDNFSNCQKVLKKADFDLAAVNEIYRTGVIGQFNLTFEFARKALQAMLKEYGVSQAQIGSPREILQIGYQTGFIDEDAVWLLMLKKRNSSTHIYSEADIDELLLLIRERFTEAFTVLENTLNEKLHKLNNETIISLKYTV